MTEIRYALNEELIRATRLPMSRLALICFLLLAAVADSRGQTAFNPFTEDLPKLLETDALTVMVRGASHDFASRLCARVDGPTSKDVQDEVKAWRERNDAFVKAAASALTDIAERHVEAGGDPAKQAYLQRVLLTTARESNKWVMRQLNGASLDNSTVPSQRACSGLASLLRQGTGDFENAPDITRALVVYMQRKELQ